MSEDQRGCRHSTVAGSLAGTVWFIGWLFTVGFAGLTFWKAVLALIIWPYDLGAHFR